MAQSGSAANLDARPRSSRPRPPAREAPRRQRIGSSVRHPDCHLADPARGPRAPRSSRAASCARGSGRRVGPKQPAAGSGRLPNTPRPHARSPPSRRSCVAARRTAAHGAWFRTGGTAQSLPWPPAGPSPAHRSRPARAARGHVSLSTSSAPCARPRRDTRHEGQSTLPNLRVPALNFCSYSR